MSLRGILKGLFVSIILTVFVILVISVIMYFTNVSEKFLSIGVYVGTAISVITGSIICARVSGAKILINCLCFAALFLLLIIALSLIKNGSILFNAHFLTMSAGVFACSVLGAVIGR